MKRTAKECVTTSPDTAKTFHPCHDKGDKVIEFEQKVIEFVTKYIQRLKQVHFKE